MKIKPEITIGNIYNTFIMYQMYVNYFDICNTEWSHSVICKNVYLLIYLLKKDYIRKGYI